MANETYTAERGSGAALNGEPIRVSDTDELIRALLVTGFPYDRDKVPAALVQLGENNPSVKTP
jgi:myo-inositol-1(or 4)-monophosphatase